MIAGQVAVKLDRIAAVRPPRALPTNLFDTMFIGVPQIGRLLHDSPLPLLSLQSLLEVFFHLS
jgi:hypothetical protein